MALASSRAKISPNQTQKFYGKQGSKNSGDYLDKITFIAQGENIVPQNAKQITSHFSVSPRRLYDSCTYFSLVN